MANLFPRWTNWLPLQIILCLGMLGTAVSAGIWYYFTPKYTRVGYQPVQPVPYSHEIHVSQLGMDCRYCHSNVEVSGYANVPSTQTCMNCHTNVQAENPKLQPVRDSWASGLPVNWVKIHQVPDYAYFNHSVHVNRGVSCASCHGQVNHMEVVYQHEPQSMGWCLECHRNPQNFIRPKEHVFNLDWKPEDIGETQKTLGERLVKQWNINPPQDCSACHR